MKYWKRIDGNGIATTVESYSFDLDIDGAIEITKTEYDSFIASLPPPPPPEPVRNLAAELDALKQKLIDKGIISILEI